VRDLPNAARFDGTFPGFSNAAGFNGAFPGFANAAGFNGAFPGYGYAAPRHDHDHDRDLNLSVDLDGLRHQRAATRLPSTPAFSPSSAATRVSSTQARASVPSTSSRRDWGDPGARSFERLDSVGL
jgi:hypothetical protein